MNVPRSENQLYKVKLEKHITYKPSLMRKLGFGTHDLATLILAQ